MEKTWQQKLSMACVDYYAAVEKEKSGSKLAELLNNWGEVSKSALLQAAEMEFKEILSWIGIIAPGLQSVYAATLKLGATNQHDRLLAVMLAGDSDEVTEISTTAEIAMLAEIAENIISENLPRDKARANFLTAVNNRPDILTFFKSETFKKFVLYDENAPFLKNEKLDLLLNCFNTSKDYKNFNNKIKAGERFIWHFNNNERIVKKWGELSSAELAGTEDFNLIITIYDRASEDWRNDLNNFKLILKHLDNKHFTNFILSVKNYQGEKSFYYDAAMVARDLLIKERLKDDQVDFKQLYYEAGLGYSVKDFHISKTKRKVIKAYLKA